MQAVPVAVKPYEAFLGDVAAVATAGKTIYIDASKVSYAVYQVGDCVEVGWGWVLGFKVV